MENNKLTRVLIKILENPDDINALKMNESEQSHNTNRSHQIVFFEYKKLLFVVGWRSIFDIDSETNFVEHEFRALKPGVTVEEFSYNHSSGISVIEKYTDETTKFCDNPELAKQINDLFEVAKSKYLGIDSSLDKILASGVD